MFLWQFEFEAAGVVPTDISFSPFFISLRRCTWLSTARPRRRWRWRWRWKRCLSRPPVQLQPPPSTESFEIVVAGWGGKGAARPHIDFRALCPCLHTNILRTCHRDALCSPLSLSVTPSQPPLAHVRM